MIPILIVVILALYLWMMWWLERDYKKWERHVATCPVCLCRRLVLDIRNMTVALVAYSYSAVEASEAFQQMMDKIREVTQDGDEETTQGEAT